MRPTFLLVGLLLMSGCAGPNHRHGSEFSDESLKPALLSPIHFHDFSVIGPVTSQGAKRLQREKIKVGSDSPDAYEFLAADPATGDNRVRTETVEEYLAARRKGAGPFTTFDITMDSFFVRAASALVFLERAVPARIKLMDRASFADLSVSFLNWTGTDEEEELLKKNVARGLTLRDYQRLGRIKRLKISPTELRFETPGMNYSITCTWLASGDFNHDGFEDGLIEVAFQAFERECTETFWEGHVQAFGFFGGVPRRITYDNTKVAVAQILGGGKERRLTHGFLQLKSHYLFAHHFCRIRRGNEKGVVEDSWRSYERVCWPRPKPSSLPSGRFPDERFTALRLV